MPVIELGYVVVRISVSLALLYALALMVWLPAASVEVSNVVPPFLVVTLSTVQSTLMTAGSITLTVRTPGFVTAPAADTVESIGLTKRHMPIAICSRDTG